MRANGTKRMKEYAGGALMLLLGIGAMVQGQTYTIGTLSRMGPGYFPVALGAILALLGLALLIGARLSQPPEDEKPLPPEWRGWICIIAGIVAFSVIGKYGGLIPATIAIVFISAMGERENTWQGAAVLSLAMVAFAVVVFWWALKLQFPLFAWGHA